MSRVKESWWWSAHTHSKHSINDALPSVWAPSKPAMPSLVSHAHSLDYPALGLTDHGNMAGTPALYRGCRAYDIEPLPGLEGYVTFDASRRPSPRTFHMTFWALSETGFRNLVGLNNAAFSSFYRKPLVTMDYLAAAAHDGRLEGMAAGSACASGILAELLRDEDADVLNVLSALAAWFGDSFYLEVMEHGLAFPGHNDRTLNEAVVTIAARLGLPVLLTQDSHYVRRGDRLDHDFYKELTTWKTNDPEDARFGGTVGYHLTSQDEMESKVPANILAAGKEGLVDLCGKAKVVIPELESFSFRVPTVSVTDNPSDELRAKVEDRAHDKHGKKPPKRYWDRAVDELAIITEYGFTEYLLLVTDVCDWMREHNIITTARGSASGSLVCYYLGITQVDPVKFGLPFERFISPDRGKPPDIDLDLPDDQRADVLNYLGRRFHMLHIANWIEGKLDDEDETKGSLIVKWKSQYKRVHGEYPSQETTEKSMPDLLSLSQHAPYTHVGVNAAGVLLASDKEDFADLPLMRVANSKMLVSAYDKRDVEDIGLLKLDLLGLKTLRAMRITRDICGVGLDEIPLRDLEVFKRLRHDKTEGIFQLQGFTNAKVIRRLKPTKLSDIIASVALGRPAIMGKALDQFIARKHGTQNVPEHHDIIAEATKDTYGIMLYQEQVITVLRGLGFTPIELARALKAIKASNSAVGSAKVDLEELKSRVISEARGVGMNDKDVAWLEESFVRYADYSFNKSHSTAYGLMAYYSAWYATHHPIAFWAGALTAFTGDKSKEARYKHAARQDGVKLFRPHVNKSGIGYTPEIRLVAVRYGLLTIPQVGPGAAEELVAKRPFASLSDLGARVDARKVSGAKGLREGHSPSACGGAVAEMDKVGALEGL